MITRKTASGQLPPMSWEIAISISGMNDKASDEDGTKHTCRAHEQCAQAGDDPIRGTQVGCALAPAIGISS